MSILGETPSAAKPTDEDDRAIRKLHDAFQKQRAAFGKDRDPSIDVRRERLGALIAMLVGHRDRISAALQQDFATHPAPAADLIETLGQVGRARYVLENLETWMAPSVRPVDPVLMGTARAEVRYQPKGVIGNMVPWNFPFDLSVGPLVEMLAAGNRVIIKPSEYTPASGALLAEIVADAFDPDLVTVVNGGLNLARAFSATAWDHLLYTGNPAVARQVMAAAAANLTPVTLELGGKNPVIMTPGSVTARNVESVIGTKIVKNGQMCTSADHVLVARDEVERFVDEARAYMDRASPGYSRGPDVTGIISDPSPRPPDRYAGRSARPSGADRHARRPQRRRPGHARYADVAGDRSTRRPPHPSGGSVRPDLADPAV